MTASERARQINKATENFDDGWKLCDDAEHWSNFGIETGDDLDAYLAWSDWVDLYKETHGIKPRWTHWRDRSAREWEAAVKSEIDSLNNIAAAEEAAAQAHAAAIETSRGPVLGLTWSPFAALGKQ